MNPTSSEPRLSKSTTRTRYREMETAKNRTGIADFIRERLTERFIDPVESTPREQKHGFTTMALSCLLVETLESFWHGWPDSKGKSQEAFEKFLNRAGPFREFAPHAKKFFYGVRCGLLHQGETTRGWRVVRNGPLFAEKTLTINATVFHRRLGHEINAYAEMLRTLDWEAKRWKKFRDKMDAICRNCDRLP
ncbi:MAG TPA: hypothetical protein VHO24_13775 [Opitutaceae bacterium]|nr:hypothetical protein [Opitutaceae bacterium]